MALDQRLIEKGQSMPRKGLAQEGKVHVGLAEQYAAALADSGWSPEDTAALKANVETLDSAIGGQAEARDRDRQDRHRSPGHRSQQELHPLPPQRPPSRLARIERRWRVRKVLRSR